METYPEGKLICCHHGKYCKWYRSNGHTKTYIPKSNKALAEKLAVKKYLTSTLDDLIHEKTALAFYLRHHHPASQKQELLLRELPGYAELLAPYFKLESPHLEDWIHATYEQNPKYPEHLIHKTVSGHLVRSKSEAIIASLLYTNHIPFRYECALHLNGIILYPDFTILHPHTEEVFYWEHFGMMDDPSYSKNAVSKLHTYISHGFIPSINLITTYETLQNPLNAEVVQKTIAHYFL